MTAACHRSVGARGLRFGCRAASKKKVSTTPAPKRQMPWSKGPIWDHFLSGEKQNGSHIHAHCRGCIEKEWPDGDILELDDEGTTHLLSQSWVIEGKYCLLGARGLTYSSFCDGKACKKGIGGILGVKDSMVAHILGKGGNSPCPNASSEARKTARKVKNPEGEGKRGREDSGDDSDHEDRRRPAKKQLVTKVKTSLKQSHLKVFRGIKVPFNEEQQKIVHKQFLRATVSTNLPFRWVEDPEIITLFLLFRSTADEVMPSRQQLSGRLLYEANTGVTKRLKEILRGEYAVLASDGWKDESRDSVNGVNISVGGKVSLLQLVWVITHDCHRLT